MGQIVAKNAKPKRANLVAIWTGSLANYIPDNGEYILVSSDNSMTQQGDGNFDAYIVGDGTAKASELPIHSDTADFLELKKVTKGNNWTNGIVTAMKQGVTYYLRWSASATIYLKVYDSQGTATMVISNRGVIGPYVFEYTPSYDIPKVDVYSSVATIFSILVKNDQKSIVTQSDVVNNITEGGAKKVLSAEQGKGLADNMVFFDTFCYTLGRGTFNNIGYHTDNYNNARAIIKNEGIEAIYIKSGYEFIVYGKSDAIYDNTSLINIKTTYSGDVFVNTATANFLWIVVKRTDNGIIPLSELTEILYIKNKNSKYNLRSFGNTADPYKIGKKRTISFTYQSGETYCDYVDVTKINAFEFVPTIPGTYNDVRFDVKFTLIWYDAEKTSIGSTKLIFRTQELIGRAMVPASASFMKLNTFGSATAIYDVESYEESIYGLSGLNPIGSMKKLTLIIVHGQSLAVGAGSSAISTGTSYYPLRMFNWETVSPNYRKDSPTAGILTRLRNGSLVFEYPERGMGEMFIESIAKENNISVYSNDWENHLILFAGAALGNSTIATLSDATNFGYIENIITKTRNTCEANGWDFDIPCWVWMQGEQDIKEHMSADDYKAALLSLHEMVCTAVNELGGISTRPKCVLYQPATQCLFSQDYSFSNPYMDMMNAYVELLKDNNEFIASTPAYIFDGSDNNEGFIHLDSKSYKWLGAFNGYAIKRYVIDNILHKGVIPTSVTVSGSTITIKYNVPCPPLVFDENWIRTVPNYGFNVVKSDNTELISSVSVLGDTVTIVCSESPVGAKLRYGMNGDVHHYPNSNYNGADGRLWGGRGCLRDCQGDYVQKEIKELGGIKMRLDNYAYCFEKLLS